MFDLFKLKAEAAGSEVHRFKKDADALQFIRGFLKQEEIQDTPGLYAVWADNALMPKAGTVSFENPGVKFLVTRDSANNAKLGITKMDWGMAETGTVIRNSTSVETRLASSLPEIHIACLETGQILPDLPTILKKIHPHEPSCFSFITGPSRTADIERVLAIGVHGPKRLVILCIDTLESAGQ
ncbi:MAG: lactate utilization protein [Nitrospirota bacterium]